MNDEAMCDNCPFAPTRASERVSTHTPGPWTVEVQRAVMSDSKVGYRIVAPSRKWGVAHVNELPGENAIANARLIASAPRLADEHARMKEALERIARGEGAFNRDPLKHAENVIEEHKELARALLAEIEGQP